MIRPLLPLLLASFAFGCGPPAPSVKIVAGAQHASAADAAMRAGGVVFAPYEQLPVLGMGELTQDHYRCIYTVNQAVGEALARRYAITPASGRKRASRPGWVRGREGPRVAIHVDAIRCGLVLGEGGYAAVASGDPGGPGDILGGAVLIVHDRSTGQPMMQIRAEAIGPDGYSAAKTAATRAVGELAPGAE